MANQHTLISEVLAVLNDTGSMTDFYNGTRTGSYFFGPDQDISHNRFMPKGQVRDGPSSPTNDKSFGYGYTRTKYATVMVFLYTIHNDVGSGTTYKNRDLLYEMNSRVGSALENHKFNSYSLVAIEDFDSAGYNKEQKYHWLAMPITFQRRDNG